MKSQLFDLVPLKVFPRFRAQLLAVVLLTWCATGLAQRRVDVAIVTDGPQYQLQEVEQIFRDELLALTADEFDVRFKQVDADWSVPSVIAAMETAYADPEIDMVLVIGFAGNQIMVSRESFAKPTFLPLVFNPELLDAPVREDQSGRRNLNYLADRVPFSRDLESFQRVMPFANAAILVDTVILAAVPRAPRLLQEQGESVNFTIIGHDGRDHDLLAKLPAQTEAVLLGGLPRMPRAEFDQLLNDITENRLPSFSMVSEAEVKRGALASDTVQTDYQRLARRNALNMQAVMLGERAEDQPVYFDGKRQLTINMETARRIGLSPRFDVLSEAEELNAQPDVTGPELGLEEVARLAMERNLDLAVSRYDVEIGAQDVRSARSSLLPQLSISGNYTGRSDEDLLRGPGSTERSTAGALTLNQLIYSESASSQYRQQKLFQQGREAGLDAARLDLIFEATTAYLQALRADTQLAIQQDNLALTKTNLELARDRVRVGSASNADVYRWESNLANARAAVLAALAVKDQARDSLNRILNQPIKTPLQLRPSTKTDAFKMPLSEFEALVDNPRRFAWFVDFNVQIGLEGAPELEQLRLQKAAADRDIKAQRRSYWLPDFSLQAQYADNLDASGLGSGTAFDRIDDWNVSLNASLPLYSGGVRRANLSRARFQRDQLLLRHDAAAERIESSIRAALHAAQASYANIELSELSATAARKNLELVLDAYGQGTLSIIDLLDAQNQSLEADLSANNAIHDFLIDIMNLQRARSDFDFLQPGAVQDARVQALREYIESRSPRSKSNGASP